MFSIFLTPEYAPFAIAFAVMVGIGLIEVIGRGIGYRAWTWIMASAPAVLVID